MKGVWKSVSYWSMIRKAGELVTHPLSAWETSDKNTGPTARHFAWMPAVYTPTERGIDMRETFFAYRDARKDTTRAANRIWSFCSRHGFDVDRKIGKKRCAEIVANAKASGLSAPVVGRVEGLVKDWTDAVARCAGREKAIVRAVAANADMTRLLQVPGIRFIGAFAIVAFVEDIRRFESPKKFVSYVGLNPSVCGSGASSPCSAGTSSWTIRFPAGTGRPSPRANSHCSRARPGLRPSAPQVMNLPWISLKTIVLVFTDICQNGRSRRSRFVLMLDKPHRCVLGVPFVAFVLISPPRRKRQRGPRAFAHGPRLWFELALGELLTRRQPGRTWPCRR